MLIGVISDTHGLVRPEALDALRGSAVILHAGDIGAPEVLTQLELLAPVHAVRGNNDVGPWAASLPHELTVELDGFRVHVVHDIADFRDDLSGNKFDAVVFGHSHRMKNEMRAGVLMFNPGSAGPRRFTLPISVGALFTDHPSLRGQLITLDV